MHKLLATFSLIFSVQSKLYCQDIKDSINEKEVSRIINILASDSLRGRGNYSPHLILAADFISKEFRNYGLRPFSGEISFVQPFQSDEKPVQRDLLYWNNKLLNVNQFVFLSRDVIPEPKHLSDFTLIEISDASDDSILLKYWNASMPVLLWIKKSLSRNSFIPDDNTLLPDNAPNSDILIVNESEIPSMVRVERNPAYLQNVLFNVVAVLPGRSRVHESIIFSAHYDHLGTEKRSSGDSIFNGANDNASGTTALLALARYFSMRNDNERTLIFCAFAGEELGLLGSNVFVNNNDVENIKAVFNIEMIGRQYRKRSFFITGEEYSDLGRIMRKKLKGNEIRIISDPIPEKKLFTRSDNYPFALKGISAHTIIGSGDEEFCYHQQCDEVSRIDINEMVRIIKAIAAGSRTIISGEDTPKRINTNRLH